MEDLTLLFIHAGKLPEKWVAFHKEQLDKLPYPIIDLYDEEKINYERIYKQLLIGCKQATTPFVGVVEDDVLYSPEHFSKFRPPLDTFSYNQHRWALFTWDKGLMYSMRQRKSNCSLIAPRELAIEALEERFSQWPDGMPPQWVGELGRTNVEKWLKVTPRKSVEWFSEIGIVQVNHDNGTEERQKEHWKAHGQIKAYDIPLWGKSSELIQKYA